jgi:GNAT superfamily N-acetyltransferase
MSAGTLPLQSSPNQGLRPVNIRRDLAQIASLMDMCFGDTLDLNGRGAVREMEALSHSGPLLWLLGAVVPQWQWGFVWVENGKVIGNVSTQMSEFDRFTWLIANVAVHPDYRRRGIGTALTQAAMRLAEEHNARRAMLQVHQNNTVALNIYGALDFHIVTVRTTWERVSVLEPPSIAVAGLELRPARREEWQADFAYVKRLRPAGFNWLRPLRKADWRPSFWRTLSHFLVGTRNEHWLAADPASGQIAGAFYVETGFGVTDQVNVIVSPEWLGRLERPLFSAALRRLGRRPWAVRVDHPAGDEAAETALTEFGFRSLQTLVWMQRNFT